MAMIADAAARSGHAAPLRRLHSEEGADCSMLAKLARQMRRCVAAWGSHTRWNKMMYLVIGLFARTIPQKIVTPQSS